MKKFSLAVFLFMSVVNCSTKNDNSDETSLLMILLANPAKAPVSTKCGVILSATLGLDTAGKFEVNTSLRTIDTWESVLALSGAKTGERVVLFFSGITATDRIRFEYSGVDLFDFSPGSRKSTSTDCPYTYSKEISGFNTLGMTINNSVSNSWKFNASATTPSALTMLIARDTFDDLTKTLKVIKEPQ
ncbi:hypothetical protein EHQ23_07380 [Leptospira bourretii]|uniref:Uncharacterized protein n=1 Tax=Leptospira bourretii TaxID=2484962 RepID=A0A4R9IIU5_9LEPT|nr:hypothetical protein [Leptospira bourretii]TGK87210.1 hypothetical protein EHQ23_07380 [Leptospira bourretii]TGK87656.1 hypothetical protein EHQ26_19435 [Leptospira bourretii]TGL43930.1 hypothetical protein EHQ45_00050 [Leptospira bourretii]